MTKHGQESYAHYVDYEENFMPRRKGFQVRA